MEKLISSFNMTSKIDKGNSLIAIRCKNCNTINIVSNISKFNYFKIKSIICKKCHSDNRIGDIYNFKTGKKLNDRLINHNQELIDYHIWSINHDNL